MSLLAFGATPLRVTPTEGDQLRSARTARLAADGTESNAAVAAAALGAEATWLSKLPANPLGRRVVESVRGHGVETAVVWANDTRQGLWFSEPDTPPREGASVQDRERVAMATVTPDELPMTDVGAADTLLTAADTLALSDRAAETVGAVFGAAKGTGTLAATDVRVRPGVCAAADARAAVEQVGDALDVLVAGEDDARAAFDADGDARELALTVAAAHDLEYVVLTRTEDERLGAAVLHDTGGSTLVHEHAGVAAETVDPAGSRDAFAGAFLAQLGEGAAADEALRYGVAAAALARTVHGPALTVERGTLDRVARDAREE